MRILVLSFYYEPDLCAGSFRTTALVNAMLAGDMRDLEVDVVSTLPNRYASFSEEAPAFEEHDKLRIHRIKLPSHDSDVVGQARAFIKFARAANQLVGDRSYDLVFATSSRLMTAALGAWIARRLKLPLYLDIRDIFVDTINDVMPRSVTVFAGPLFSWLEKWTMRRASVINLVSEGFRGYFESRYPGQKLTWHTNGIDEEFLEPVPKASVPGKITRILYAGNLGEGQCLHAIVPGLAIALADKAEIVVIGDGGRREQLESELKAEGVTNVSLKPPVSRDKLLAEYSKADVLFLHLGAYAAFEKVLPSKLFEYAATGRPILAGVAGYAAKFVAEEIPNAAVFAPGDVEGGRAAFDSLILESAPRPDFVKKFSRPNISRLMALEIVSFASGHHS